MGKSNQYWILLSSEKSGGRWRGSEQAEGLRKCISGFQGAEDRFGNQPGK